MTALKTSWGNLHKCPMPQCFRTQTSHLLYKCTFLCFSTNHAHSLARWARRQRYTSLHSHPPKTRMSHSHWLLKKGFWLRTVLFPEPCLVILQKELISTEQTHPTSIPWAMVGQCQVPGLVLSVVQLPRACVNTVHVSVCSAMCASDHHSLAQSSTQKDNLFKGAI